MLLPIIWNFGTEELKNKNISSTFVPGATVIVIIANICVINIFLSMIRR